MSLQMYEEKAIKPLEKIAHVIGVAAGKGGVGKSFISVNIALALKERGYRVGLLDADIYGPSIQKMLPEDRLPTKKGKWIVPSLSYGIRTLSMAHFRKEGEAAVVRAPIANGIIQQFIGQVDWGELDYLLIDFPPGTGDVQLTLSQHASLTGSVMVTTPQEIAMMDVKKAMHMFSQVNVPIIGVVENMSYYLDIDTNQKKYLFGKEGGKKLAREMGVPFLGSVPLHPSFSACSDQGCPIFTQKGLDPLKNCIHSLAEEIDKQVLLLEEVSSDCLSQFELIWK